MSTLDSFNYSGGNNVAPDIKPGHLYRLDSRYAFYDTEYSIVEPTTLDPESFTAIRSWIYSGRRIQRFTWQESKSVILLAVTTSTPGQVFSVFRFGDIYLAIPRAHILEIAD